MSRKKIWNRPETDAGTLTCADQACAVFGESDDLSMSSVSVKDNRFDESSSI